MLENLARRWQAQLVHGPWLFPGSGLGTKALVMQFEPITSKGSQSTEALEEEEERRRFELL